MVFACVCYCSSKQGNIVFIVETIIPYSKQGIIDIIISMIPYSKQTQKGSFPFIIQQLQLENSH